MSTTTTRRIPPSYLANTCLALSAFLLANNTNGLLRPRSALEILGFKYAIAPTDQKLVEGLMRMFSATRICLSLNTMAMWWYRDYRVMGWSMLVGTLMAGVDGWVSKEVIGEKQWGHWGASPISIGLGGGLLALCGV